MKFMKRFLAILVLIPLSALGQPLSNSFNAIIAGTVNATTNFVGEGGGITLANDATNSVQAVRLSQLQNLLPSSSTYYLYGSSNAFAASFGVGTTANTNYCYNVPSSGGANTMTMNGVTTGEYLVSYVTADTFKAIGAGSINVDFYASFNSGAGRACSLVAEIYVLDTVANSLVVEYGTPVAQAITGSPAEYVFTVAATNYTSANPLRLVAKIKVATQANNPNVSIVTENGQASHIDFNIPSSSFVLKSGDTMTGALIGTTSTMTTVNDATVNAGALNVTNTATIATEAVATGTYGTSTFTNAPTIKATGLSINGVSLAFPSTNATANQLLRNDGSGNLTWTNVSSGAGLANTVLGPGSATTAHAVMSFSDTTGTNAEQNAGITTSGGASLTASSFTATGDLTPSSGLGFFGNLYTATNINPSSLLSLNTFQWRKSQADMLLQSNRVHKVLFITDSWGSYPPNGGTVGPVTNYVTVLQNALKSQYGDAGSCVSVSVYNSLWNHGPNSMLMYTNGGDGSSFTISQDYIVNENTNGTPAPYYLVTNPVPSVSWKFYFDNHFSLHGNSMVFKTNGVAFGSPPNTGGFQTYTVTFPTADATNMVELDMNAANEIYFYAIEFITGNRGVSTYNSGKTARNADDLSLAALQSTYDFLWSTFAPDLVTLDLGQNDLDGGKLSKLATNLVRIITNIQVTLPSASLAVIARPDVAITNSGNSMVTVEGIVRTVAMTNSVAYIDAFHVQPNYSVGLNNLLYVDTKHYGYLGQAMYADIIYRALMGCPMTMNYHP